MRKKKKTLHNIGRDVEEEDWHRPDLQQNHGGNLPQAKGGKYPHRYKKHDEYINKIREEYL